MTDKSKPVKGGDIKTRPVEYDGKKGLVSSAPPPKPSTTPPPPPVKPKK